MGLMLLAVRTITEMVDAPSGESKRARTGDRSGAGPRPAYVVSTGVPLVAGSGKHHVLCPIGLVCSGPRVSSFVIPCIMQGMLSWPEDQW